MKNLIIGLLLVSCLIVNSCHSQVKANGQEKEEAKIIGQLPKNINAQIDEYVIEIFEDAKGDLWFGTLSKGVAKYDGKTLRYYTTEDGLIGNYVSSVVEDNSGNLWFGTHSGISKFDGQSFTNFTEHEGLCDNNVSNLLFDKTGHLWVGTWGGICKFDGNSFLRFSLPKPDIDPPSYQSTMNWSTEIVEDSKGNIWFGRDGYGACKYDGNAFTHFTKKEGLASNNVREIQEDKYGNIWFGSRVTEKDHPDADQRVGPGGLVKYDGENFISFPEIAGLSDNDVYQIYSDSKENLWISTTSHGIYKYNGKEFTNYAVNYAGAKMSKAVVSILEDSRGTIWIGCAGGLFRLNSDGIVNVTTNGPWD